MVTDKLYRCLGSLPSIQTQARRIVKRLPHRLRTVERFGQRLIVDPSDLCGFYLYYEREYDDFIFHFLDGVIHKYSEALDIGANIGIYTCYFAARLEHVDAFEPEPSLCSWLKRNIALNHLTNVSIHETCVGLENGTVSFFPARSDNFGAGSMIGTNQGVPNGIERPCICLDDFARDGSHGPCLIKMDIEGAEWLALRGARKMLAHPGASIDMLLEIHPREIQRLGGTPIRLKMFLGELGYSIAALSPRGLLPLDGSEDAQRFWWVSRHPENVEKSGH